MEKRGPKLSSEQQDLLNSARRAGVYELPRLAFTAVKRLKDNESLHPDWKALWDSARTRIRAEAAAPEEVLRVIDEAITQIEFIDPEISKLRLRTSDRVCLLLGAGASAPPPSSIPTVNQLLPELWRRAGRIGREDIDRLSSWCKEHHITNIEDLLTAAYLANFAAKNSNITGLLDYFLFRASTEEVEVSRSRVTGRARTSVPRVDTSSIALLQDTLQVLFGLLTGTMIPASPNKSHESVVSFVASHSRSSIITTNYDGCVDEALIRAKRELNTYVNDSETVSEGAIDLIKIHGSINWSYCDSCHEARDFSLLDLKKAYDEDTASYAVIGICKSCGGQRRPLLIPPMGLKFIMFPNLIRLWSTARERLEEAECIVVVGFSFSEADSYLNKIIERSMTRKKNQKLVICDPNAALASALRTRFSARIDSFDEARVLPAIGSAEEVVPSVLAAILETAGDEADVAANARKRRSIAV